VTVLLTYDDTLSRVHIEATALPAAADHVIVERSTNQTNWSVIRGGTAVPVVAAVASAYDYEFAPGVVNYYRVSAVDAGAITYVAAGATASNANAAGTSTLSPGLPAGLQQYDLMLMLAIIRNVGAGVPQAPAGWTRLAVFGASSNVQLFGKIATASESAPTVSFTGGVANATIAARIAAWRNAGVALTTSATQTNVSAQNIAYPAANITADGQLVIIAGWKQDDWTSAASIAGMTEIGETSETGGDDAAQVWDYVIQTTAANIAAGSIAITGGVSAVSAAATVVLGPAPYLTRESDDIAPAPEQVWVKSIPRPFLNRAVVVQDYSEITRPSRSGVFDVVGRSFPVAVTDVAGSRRWTLHLLAANLTEARLLDLLAASGDPLYIQVPLGCDVPGGYVVVGDTTERRPARRSLRRILSLPCTEVAAPDSSIVGSTVTCATVLATYATCADVLLAHPTCLDLLTLIGDPDEIEVDS
jgi:hypothetical protein